MTSDAVEDCRDMEDDDQMMNALHVQGRCDPDECSVCHQRAWLEYVRKQGGPDA